MKYKKSKYNLWVPYADNKTIIYNTLSTSIGVFDSSTFERFQLNTLDEKEQSTLYNKGILIDADYEELEKINQDRIDSINRCTYKNLRIWTTTSCNANCYYCFEKNIPSYHMQRDVADDVLNYINSTLNPHDTVEVCWFGGEPLMNPDIIDYMTPKIMDFCRKKDCHYKFSMISNGSLITRKLADKMKNIWSIGFIQITLDGFGTDYDIAKNYNNPKLFNFQRVIDNIKLMAAQDIKISIRMNYDTSNYEALRTLITFLSEELKEFENIRYYVYPVWSTGFQDDETAYHSNTKCDLKLIALYDLLVELKLTTMRQVARLIYRKNQCMACNKFSYSIMPNGDLIKCCETSSHIIGNVRDGITNYNEYESWTWEGLYDDCKECILLPMCQGGCRAGYLGIMEKCVVTKNILPDILRWYVSRKETTINRTKKSK